MTSFNFMDLELVADATGALYWPETRLLVISDWHLAKSRALAARGGHLLPPYDDAENLNRLADVLTRFDAQTVLSLGDSFDHRDHGLDPTQLDRLNQLMTGRDWIWVLGNHDPTLPHALPGLRVVEHSLSPLTFRHEAKPQTQPGEVSGHYHPKASLKLRGRRIRGKCFAVTADRLILPAFGTYTGGLDITDPAFGPYLSEPYRLLLCHGEDVRLIGPHALS